MNFSERIIEILVATLPLFIIIGIQALKLKRITYSLEQTLLYLGYYRLRFGFVTAEDIIAGVGLDKKIREKAGLESSEEKDEE